MEGCEKEEAVIEMPMLSNLDEKQTTNGPVSFVPGPCNSSETGDSSSGDSASITISNGCLDRAKPVFYRHSSAFTEELPHNIELEVFRHGWANRIITDQDGNPLYYADIPWQWTGTKLDIYRGNPENKKAIVSLSRKPLNKRMFFDFHGEDDERVEIVGSRAYLGFDYFFYHSGRQYRWRETQRRFQCSQYEILMDIENKEIIARFKNASLLQIWRKKRYGALVIYSEAWKTDAKLLDMVVMTLIAVKQRIRGKKRLRGFWNLLVAAGESAAG